MLTPAETETLRAILAREAAPAIGSQPAKLTTGDVVQILPAADRTFGGMLALVQQATPHQVRAILLRPHRGGCREAWLRLTPPEVARIGTAAPHNPDFAKRCEHSAPGCRRIP
jgi:hypothetical protein